MTNASTKPSGRMGPPGALLLAAIAGAAVATMLARGGPTLFAWSAIQQPASSQGQPLLPGDEAPIRVRGGSLFLELLSSEDDWEEDNSTDRKNWKIPGKRTHDLQVTVAVNPGANCNVRSGSGKTLVVTYTYDKSTPSNKTTVEFKSAGNHTKLKSKDHGLDHSVSRTLAYKDAAGKKGYISGLALMGGSRNLNCTFTDKAQLDHLVILDHPDPKK